MNILVTGHTGFIGSHVYRALAGAGHAVWGIDSADGPHDDVRRFFAVDARRDGLADPGFRYDAVVHCAAVVGGRRVIDWTPIKHAANLAIDAALFEWAERTRPGRVVYFSSSCAYPAALGHAKRPLLEDDIRWPPGPACWPDGLYGWAKLTGELLARTAQDAGVPVTIVRPFSVYGPGMNDGFAVSGFAAQVAQRADPLVIWGDDRQVRDYIHVADVAAAVLAAIEAGAGGPVNLGTGQGTSLACLALTMAASAGYMPQIKVDASMPAGVAHLVAGTSRLHEFYVPKVALEDGLAEVLR